MAICAEALGAGDVRYVAGRNTMLFPPWRDDNEGTTIGDGGPLDTFVDLVKRALNVLGAM